MDKYVVASDGSQIHYTETVQNHHNITLVFVHGWLGNTNWWNDQELYFKDKYNIVKIDLPGHGKSDKSRQNWTGEQYANDIKFVVEAINTAEVILVGHSMSGAYVVEASVEVPQVKAVVLVDTLRDLDQNFTPEQAEEHMFSSYREDFKSAVENLLPQYLFVEQTPEKVKKQLQAEFLQNESDLAIDVLRPLYEIDICTIAKQVKVPVRAINSDAAPTSSENNKKYFIDYDYKILSQTGHYPMLEKPDEFNKLLNEVLNELKSLNN